MKEIFDFIDTTKINTLDALQLKCMIEDVRSKAIDEFAEKLKSHVGEHYVDCDGYFGGIKEEILYADYIDEIAEQMKGGAIDG